MAESQKDSWLVDSLTFRLKTARIEESAPANGNKADAEFHRFGNINYGRGVALTVTLSSTVLTPCGGPSESLGQVYTLINLSAFWK
jgi:hypothetical protein